MYLCIDINIYDFYSYFQHILFSLLEQDKGSSHIKYKFVFDSSKSSTWEIIQLE